MESVWECRSLPQNPSGDGEGHRILSWIKVSGLWARVPVIAGVVSFREPVVCWKSSFEFSNLHNFMAIVAWKHVPRRSQSDSCGIQTFSSS